MYFFFNSSYHCCTSSQSGRTSLGTRVDTVWPSPILRFAKDTFPSLLSLQPRGRTLNFLTSLLAAHKQFFEGCSTTCGASKTARRCFGSFLFPFHCSPFNKYPFTSPRPRRWTRIERLNHLTAGYLYQFLFSPPVLLQTSRRFLPALLLSPFKLRVTNSFTSLIQLD